MMRPVKTNSTLIMAAVIALTSLLLVVLQHRGLRDLSAGNNAGPAAQQQADLSPVPSLPTDTDLSTEHDSDAPQHQAAAPGHIAAAQPEPQPPVSTTIPDEPPSVHQPSPVTIVLTAQKVELDAEAYRPRFQSAGSIEVVKIIPVTEHLRQHMGPFDVTALSLPTPDGKMLMVDVIDHRIIAGNRGVFRGKVNGQPLSEVILAYYEDAMTGSIIIPGSGHYEISPTGDGNHLLIEIDPDKILPEAQPLIPPVDGDD